MTWRRKDLTDKKIRLWVVLKRDNVMIDEEDRAIGKDVK